MKSLNFMVAKTSVASFVFMKGRMVNNRRVGYD